MWRPARLLIGFGGLLVLLGGALAMHSRPAGAAAAGQWKVDQGVHAEHSEHSGRGASTVRAAVPVPADMYRDNTVLSATSGSAADLTLPLAALGGISLVTGSLLAARGGRRRTGQHAR